MDTPPRMVGATLVELLATAGIIAIVGAIAIPNLASFRRNAARTVIVNDVVHTVFLARSEAIKRNSVVSVCRSNDGRVCANAAPNWNSGWIVFENLDRDQPAELDAGEPILYRHARLTTGTLNSNRDSFSFRPFNQGDVNGTFTYCPLPKSKDGRAVIISHTGRPRTSNRDASGKAIVC